MSSDYWSQLFSVLGSESMATGTHNITFGYLCSHDCFAKCFVYKVCYSRALDAAHMVEVHADGCKHAMAVYARTTFGGIDNLLQLSTLSYAVVPLIPLAVFRMFEVPYTGSLAVCSLSSHYYNYMSKT